MNLNHIFMQGWCYVIELTINTERQEVRKLWNWTYATSRCSLLPRLVFHRRSMLVCAPEDSNKKISCSSKYRKKQNQIIILRIDIIVYWQRKHFKLIFLINRGFIHNLIFRNVNQNLVLNIVIQCLAFKAYNWKGLVIKL